jgi:hypothetical protein
MEDRVDSADREYMADIEDMEDKAVRMPLQGRQSGWDGEGEQIG